MDAFGSKSKTSSTSQPFTGDNAQRSTDIYNLLRERLNNPESYTGQLTTPTTAATNAGISGLTAAANNPTLQQFASGANIDPASNPYLQDVIGTLKQQSEDQYGDLAKAIDSRAANRSFWDSSGHSAALSSAANKSNENFTNALANLENTAYQQGVSNMISAQGANQSANSALTSAGNTEWNQNNTNLGQQYQAWKDQMGLSDQDMTDLLNWLQINKNPTTNTETQTTPGWGTLLTSGTVKFG